MSDRHPDPIAEGLTQGAQRFVQVVAIAAALHQVTAQRTARLTAAREARNRAAEELAQREIKALFEEARAQWAPAHDREWLNQADLLQTGQAWAAALPYAEAHKAAASAIRKCENRMRHLHPHAMGHYDRARANGLSPQEAMTTAAPFFTRDPNVHEGAPATTPALAPGQGAHWAATEHGPSRKEWEEALQERRADQIIQQLQDKLSTAGRPPMAADELRTVLDTTTNLPDHLVTKAVQPYIRPTAEAAPGAVGPRTAPDISADNFPHPISEAMQMSADRPAQQPANRRPAQQTTNRTRHPNR